jgi:hypothetical protein
MRFSNLIIKQDIFIKKLDAQNKYASIILSL